VVLVRGLHMWLGNEGACSFLGLVLCVCGLF
jgi:hypothetical protein